MPELDAATIDLLTAKAWRKEITLIDSAEQYTIEDLIGSFDSLRQRMLSLLNGLTTDQINFSPDPSTYSMSEVVSHLIIAQGNVYNAFLDLSASTMPHIDPVPRGPGAGAEKGLTAQILQSRLQKATEDLIAIIRQTFDPNNKATVEWLQFGKMSYKGFMLFQLSHDLDHLKQSLTLRRSPMLPKKRDTSETPLPT